MANRKYDQQLKDSVIKEVIIGERSAAQVARDHEIPESAVYSWIRAHKEKNDLAVLQYKNEIRLD
jgi:transposase-like protein